MRQIIQILRIAPLDTAILRVYTSRMNTLNIEALQKTQASIADLNYRFHMLGWCTCIYGHARRANGWTGGITETAQRLGVDPSLFYPDIFPPYGLGDRSLAIAAIQALIDAAQPAPQPEPEPEPELVCA